MNARVYFFTKKKRSTGKRVTRHETTFIRTISRNQRLPTKTPEKEHVNTTNQAEW